MFLSSGSRPKTWCAGEPPRGSCRGRYRRQEEVWWPWTGRPRYSLTGHPSRRPGLWRPATAPAGGAVLTSFAGQDVPREVAMEGSGPLGRQVSGVSGRPLPRGRDGNGCGPFPRPTTPGPGRKCRPARRADPGSGGPPGPGFGNVAADRSRGARGPRTWHPGFYHSLTLWGGPAHMGLIRREGAGVVLRHTRGHFRRAGGSERGKAS